MAGGTTFTNSALKNVYAYDGLSWISIPELPEASTWAQCYITFYSFDFLIAVVS